MKRRSMLMGKMKMKKKLYSMIMVAVMAVGLMMTVPVKAEGADEGDKLMGLGATDWMDWSDDGCPTLNPQAEMGKELSLELSNATIYAEYACENGEKIKLSAEDITFTDSEGNATEDIKASVNEKNRELIDLHFSKIGDYKIVYNQKEEDNFVELHIRLPRVGFFTDAVSSEDTYIKTDEWGTQVFKHNADNNLFYMNISELYEDEKISYKDIAYKVYDWDTDRKITDVNEQAEYFSVETEEGKQGVYKIIIKAKRGFGMSVSVPVSNEGGDNYTFEGYIDIPYEGALEGITAAYPEESEPYTQKIYIDLNVNTLRIAYAKDDEFTPITNTDGITITDLSGKPADCRFEKNTENGEGYFDFEFKKTGQYKICYRSKEGAASFFVVEVNYPEAGFYTNGDITENSYLLNWGERKYNSKQNELYLLFNNDVIVADNAEVNIYASQYDEENDTDVKLLGKDSPITVKKLSNKKYKITINSNEMREFDIKAEGGRYNWPEDEMDYELEGKSIHLTFVKEKLDTSKIAWQYKAPFTYDGKAKKVELVGLPKGLSASYTGNTATKSGNYTAKVSFSYDKNRYETPDLSKIKALQWKIVNPPISVPKRGTKLKDSKGTAFYKVTNAGKLKGTTVSGAEVTYMKPIGSASKVTIPNTVKINNITYKVTDVSTNAFKNNKKLTSVKIGNNVKTVGKNAFYGCKKLKTVTIGKNVVKINNGAFANCTALNKITIPAKTTVIGSKAFYNCKNLKTMTIKSASLKSVGSKAITGMNKKAVIKVPKNKLKAYQKLFASKTGYKKTMKIRK